MVLGTALGHALIQRWAIFALELREPLNIRKASLIFTAHASISSFRPPRSSSILRITARSSARASHVHAPPRDVEFPSRPDRQRQIDAEQSRIDLARVNVACGPAIGRWSSTVRACGA